MTKTRKKLLIASIILSLSLNGCNSNKNENNNNISNNTDELVTSIFAVKVISNSSFEYVSIYSILLK